MFVKKRNRSGNISVVVVNKEHGKFVEIKNFGTVPLEVEADSLRVKVRQWIDTYGGRQSLLPAGHRTHQSTVQPSSVNHHPQLHLPLC